VDHVRQPKGVPRSRLFLAVYGTEGGKIGKLCEGRLLRATLARCAHLVGGQAVIRAGTEEKRVLRSSIPLWWDQKRIRLLIAKCRTVREGIENGRVPTTASEGSRSRGNEWGEGKKFLPVARESEMQPLRAEGGWGRQRMQGDNSFWRANQVVG